MTDDQRFNNTLRINPSIRIVEQAARTAVSIIEKKSGVKVALHSKILIQKIIMKILRELELSGSLLIHPSCESDKPENKVFTSGFYKPPPRRKWKEKANG